MAPGVQQLIDLSKLGQASGATDPGAATQPATPAATTPPGAPAAKTKGAVGRGGRPKNRRDDE
jgi:hypothetical protein